MSNLNLNTISSLDSGREVDVNRVMQTVDYVGGLVIDSRDTIVTDGNDRYALASDTPLPYTTTGMGMPEGGAFVGVGDTKLRSELVQSVATFNNVADMVNAVGLTIGRKVRTLGYYTPGDGGGNDYEIVATGTGTDDGGSFIDLGRGLQAKGLFSKSLIYAAQFGVIAEDSEAIPTRLQTTQVAAAIDYHLSSGMRLMFKRGSYLIDGISRTGEVLTVNISSLDGRASFHVTQEAADSAAKTLEFTCSETITGLSLSADIVPGINYITLTDAAGITPGMFIEIRGTEAWPYDPRPMDNKGEIHRVSRVEGNDVYIEDFTRDIYEVTQVAEIAAWHPGSLEISGLDFITKVPDPLVSTGGLSITGFYNPVIEDCKFSEQIFFGLFIGRCIDARTNNLSFSKIGKGVANGYGISDRSSLGNVHKNSVAYGCRRAYDAHGAGYTPNRDWVVSGWVVNGGDGYYPDTALNSWGIGTHGQSENGAIIGCTISNVAFGVILRGKSTIVEGNRFIGPMYYCVTGRHGAGLTFRGNEYDCSLFPNKLAAIWSDIDDSLCAISMVQINTPSAGGWDFSLPVVIEGNTAVGVVDHAFDFPAVPLHNVTVRNNDIKLAPSTADFRVIGHNNDISRSAFSNNRVDAAGRNWSLFESPAKLGQADGIDPFYGVEVDGATHVIIEDGSFARISGIGISVDRPLVSVAAAGAGFTGREIRANNAMSSTLFESGTWNVLAEPELIDGTYGPDAGLSISLSSGGWLAVENRTGSFKRVKVSTFG